MEKSQARLCSVVCISDTHLKHSELSIPPCDILIHAGDILQFTRNLSRAETELLDFLEWFVVQSAKYKILIGGNHDLILDTKISNNQERISKLLERYPGVIYLQNSGSEVIIGNKKLKVWGIPHTDIGMAFNGLTPDMIGAIPDDTDIVVTHCPPAGLTGTGVKMDQVPSRDGPKSVGNRALYERICDIVPTLHVFGHIHGGYGIHRARCPYSKNPNKICTFVNASIEREGKQDAINDPIVLKLHI